MPPVRAADHAGVAAFPRHPQSRVDALFNAFRSSHRKSGYEGLPVRLPVKVKPAAPRHRDHQSVYSDKPRLGLEAELKAGCWPCCPIIMSKGSVIVCNGYKDRRYILHALPG